MDLVMIAGDARAIERPCGQAMAKNVDSVNSAAQYQLDGQRAPRLGEQQEQQCRS
jgi:hypothetical protein